jgi:hypothetical protein
VGQRLALGVAVALGVGLVWASPSNAFRTPDPELVQKRDKALQELEVIENNCRKSRSNDSAECLIYRKYSHLRYMVVSSYGMCRFGLESCDRLREVAAFISDLVEKQDVSPADPEKPGAHADRAAIRAMQEWTRHVLPELRAACEESESRRGPECQEYEQARWQLKTLDAAPAQCRQGNQTACDLLEQAAKQGLAAPAQCRQGDQGACEFLEWTAKQGLEVKPSSEVPKPRRTDEAKADHPEEPRRTDEAKADHPEEPRNQVDPEVCHKAQQDYETCIQDARESPGLSTAALLRMTCAKFLDLCR